MNRTEIMPMLPTDPLRMNLRALDRKDLAGLDLATAGQIWASSRVAFSLIDLETEEIIGAAGIHFMHGGKVGHVFILTTPKVKRHSLKVARALRKHIEEAFTIHGANRLETLVLTEHTQSIRLLEWLGFELEGLCRKCGPNGLDRYLYARVAP